MRKYVTVQGDMWDLISYKMYKNEHYVAELISANTQYRDVVIFPANCVLDVPDIDIKSPSGLPPWRL